MFTSWGLLELMFQSGSSRLAFAFRELERGSGTDGPRRGNSVTPRSKSNVLGQFEDIHSHHIDRHLICAFT